MWKRANTKYLLIAVCTIISIHLLLSYIRPEGAGFSKSTLDSFFDNDDGFQSSEEDPADIKQLPVVSTKNSAQKHTKPKPKVKAVFVVLVRNSDIHSLRASMRQLEDRFNHKYNYPYLFLNDEAFTDEFKRLSSAMTKGKTEYGIIPKEHWSVPDWIDYDKAKEEMKKMEEADIIYGGSESYRHMCRFESGFFFRHPLLDKYDYYWRVEPGVQFFCDIDYDPFMYMKEKKVKYGFTISLYEYEDTIKTLWETVKEFMKKYPEYIEEDNALDFISNDQGETYNLCHFWSNFEIGDLNLWRSERYLKFFEFLDQKGGFFYERWGDAPVHSIAAVLFLKKSEIHFFNEIGYKHEPFMHCPVEKNLLLKCHCNPQDNFDLQGYSCTGRWLQINQQPISN
ncbi:11155_t:CDS:2 [Ambispora gerdemannii]|uniref:11155_t:CDS:1 n=1 Tax=Ambispora gerdemannii TaxID=144530 RepID=A0A9N8V7M2_9GLOM|nr:11155_t:CDS:2 [Ambispora gerdemannii]